MHRNLPSSSKASKKGRGLRQKQIQEMSLPSPVASIHCYQLPPEANMAVFVQLTEGTGESHLNPSSPSAPDATRAQPPPVGSKMAP